MTSHNFIIQFKNADSFLMNVSGERRARNPGNRIEVGIGAMPRRCELIAEDASMPTDRLFEDHYSSDEQGRRVLIGLSFEETSEFERLDASLPFDGLHVWPDLSEDIPLLTIEVRWRELWVKHETARGEQIGLHRHA